jgi:hypothetical protein
MINKLLISKLHVTRIIQSLPEYTDSQRSLHLCEPVEGALISRWLCPGTPSSSTTNTGRHDIAEILLKVTLNTKKSKSNQI